MHLTSTAYERFVQKRPELEFGAVYPNVRAVVIKKTGGEPPAKPLTGINIVLEVIDGRGKELRDAVHVSTPRKCKMSPHAFGIYET